MYVSNFSDMKYKKYIFLLPMGYSIFYNNDMKGKNDISYLFVCSCKDLLFSKGMYNCTTGQRGE